MILPFDEMISWQKYQFLKWRDGKAACWTKDQVNKWQVDITTWWWNGLLTKLLVDEKTSCQNFKLMKWQVDETESWWNDKMEKLKVDEMTSWKNCKLMKWPGTWETLHYSGRGMEYRLGIFLFLPRLRFRECSRQF